MMLWIAGVVGGLGLICMISRKTLLGLLIGMQILILGSTMMFVMAGITSGVKTQGFIFALFITLGGVVQLIVGFGLAIRLFFLKKRISMEELQALKQ